MGNRGSSCGTVEGLPGGAKGVDDAAGVSGSATIRSRGVGWSMWYMVLAVGERVVKG